MLQSAKLIEVGSQQFSSCSEVPPHCLVVFETGFQSVLKHRIKNVVYGTDCKVF